MCIRAVILVTLLIILGGCDGTQNYEDPDGPLFAGDYAAALPADDSVIKVITWNIKFATEVEQAIAELREVEALQAADFLLLQEMDETAVDTIAQALGYHYIYFPASVHNQNHKNFGNAILSKWPLSDPQKILLPHENPTNQQTRIAVKATASVGEKKISLYSVHTETIWLPEEMRNEQVEAIVNMNDPDEQMVIVGGDFNTVTESEVTAVTDRLAEIDLRRLSAGAEPTVIKAGLAFTVDHIFARGVTLIENGVWSETEASDHFPVWVEVVLDE